jgi:hypothetical protein
MNIPAHIRNVVIPLGAPCIKMVQYVIHYQDSRYFAMFGKDLRINYDSHRFDYSSSFCC